MSARPATPPPAVDAPARPGRPWRTALVVGAAVAGLAAAAYVEGRATQRWGATDELKAASARLGGVPAAFGDWTSRDIPMDDKVLRVAEATGHVQRVYRSGKTGAELTVLLLCGPSGPIGAHTPEYCYAGNGYAAAGEPQKKVAAPPGGPAASYWSARFERASPPAAPLRVCWTWGTDGDWEAVANPRLGLRPWLYKLYVVRTEPLAPGAGAGDPTDEFLRAFLPEVRKALAAQ